MYSHTTKRAMTGRQLERRALGKEIDENLRLKRELAELQAAADKMVARIREYAEGANPPSAECLNILFICQGWQGKAVRS